MDVYGGSGGNEISVESTPFNFSSTGVRTFLDSGSGSDYVYVDGTNGPLDLDGFSGYDNIFVGNNGSLAGISGAIDVFNYVGADYLYVDDYNDPTPRNATFASGSLTWASYAAPITWVPSASSTGGVTYLDYEAGSGSNVIDVDNTDDLYHETYISAGGRNDQVNIRATTGTLVVDGGGGINTVEIGSNTPPHRGDARRNQGGRARHRQHGGIALEVDDGGDTTGRLGTLNRRQPDLDVLRGADLLDPDDHQHRRGVCTDHSGRVRGERLDGRKHEQFQPSGPTWRAERARTRSTSRARPVTRNQRR